MTPTRCTAAAAAPTPPHTHTRSTASVLGQVIVQTVAFGPPREDFKLLEEMAGVLPRGQFQKLGLNAGGLRTAFSSLSSSMSTLRTEGGGRALTRRNKTVDPTQKVDLSKEILKGSEGWWIYDGDDAAKYVYSSLRQGICDAPFSKGPSAVHLSAASTGEATGVAFVAVPFAEGAERLVYRCSEVEVPESEWEQWYERHAVLLRDTAAVGGKAKSSATERMQAIRTGLRLVCKEAKDEENLGRKFHEQAYAHVAAPRLQCLLANRLPLTR